MEEIIFHCAIECGAMTVHLGTVVSLHNCSSKCVDLHNCSSKLVDKRFTAYPAPTAVIEYTSY
jgi:hypothetical protein